MPRFPWRALRWALVCLTFLSFHPSLNPAEAQPGEYTSLQKQGENYFKQDSFAKSREVYLKASRLKLAPEQKKWVAFRLADTLWRAQAATNTSDSSTYEKARGALEKMVRDIKRTEDQDRIWVEVQESLGDFWWLRRNSKNWGTGWRYYQQALEWWAGATDLEPARDRYLRIVWNIASPAWRDTYYYYGYYGNQLPLEILENVLKIAMNEGDRSHAQYLIAMTVRQRGDFDSLQRAGEAFEAALKGGKQSEWYDDALFQYAQWLSQGEVILLADGRQQRQPNFLKSLKYYRRIIKEFKKGETRYYDQAKQNIESITRPQLTVGVSSIFLPGSEIEYHTTWRNLGRVEFSLYPVDLSRDVSIANHQDVSVWKNQLNLLVKKKTQGWSKQVKDEGDHRPGQKTFQINPPLAPGAYILKATGGGLEARELILVTDATVVLKTAAAQALVYFSDSASGAPLSGARVKLSERYYDGRQWRWRELSAKTNADGLAVFKLKGKTRHNAELFVGAAKGNRQAFVTAYHRNYYAQAHPWKVYVHTDRPAYRPNETAHWKLTARTYDGSVYATPANQTLEYQINDPRGSKIKEGKIKLNEFGSAWDAFELAESLPLGAYRITFWNTGRKKHIGEAELFRLEEYKLPEFKISVKTPETDGKPQTFQLGDTVEVVVQAEYYFGGPVANANVEILVHQKPFHHTWRPQPDYPWYYEDMHGRSQRYWGRGQQVKREVLKTDAAGQALITFKTPRQAQDMEYHIEVRVTDASRREVTGRGQVRVTRQPYYVYLNNAHNLYQPQDKAQVNIKTLDANSQPVQAVGKIRVTRDFWFEIWTDPSGKEVKGRELEDLRKGLAIFPPPPAHPGGPAWQLKFRGYQHDEILTRTVKTDAQGKAEFTFTPGQVGYYRLVWTSQVANKKIPIQGETTLWVADNATTELGYRHGGLKIIVDKDTFHRGQKAPVMLTVPTSDRYVLFSVEGDDLYSYQLVHLTGTVKLLQLDITEKHVPNIFLSALMVSDQQLFRDTQQVVVPPVENFITVAVTPDRKQYRPRDEGTLTVKTTDHRGQPVAAEVALGLVDESVYAIQKELAMDPRKFFFGTKRAQRTQTKSTFQTKRYAKLGKKDAGSPQVPGKVNELGGRYSDLKEGDSLRQAYPASKVARMAVEESANDAFGMVADSVAPVKSVAPGIAGPDSGPAVQVRSDFRTTVFWQPDVKTGKDGIAVVTVKFPDSLTQWRATARAVSTTNQFGIDTGETRTQTPLIVRLQAPRFFVVGDLVTVSAVIHNNTDRALQVHPSIEADGIVISGRVVNGKRVQGTPGAIQVAAHGEKRVDWLASVPVAGQARIQVTARNRQFADAMKKTFVVHEHGVEKFISKSGKMRGSAVTVKLNIPKERKKDTTVLTVQVTPSLAVTMLDALPYLIDFPYGCTEQTLSRFLPAVITAKTLRDLGLSPQAVQDRMFGGLQAEHTGKTHPQGKKNLSQLDKMIARGLDRLTDFQHGDGGWGWWKKGDSDPFMSAYVLWGLTLARQAGVPVDQNVLARAASFLDKELVEAELKLDLQAWMLHALAAQHASKKSKRVPSLQKKAFDNLWQNRTRLNAYPRALLALAAHHYGDRKRARILIDNLENGVVIDQSPDTSVIQRGQQSSHSAVIGTAHWGEDRLYHRWSQGGVEATAFALRALLTIDPKNKLIEPATNWLIKNRRGSHWSNTRDTAITILALNDYLKISGELESRLEYQLVVNGYTIATTQVVDVLRAPSQYLIDRKFIRDGTNEISIVRKSGKGPLYFAVQAEFFSREEPIPPAGTEIFVRRQYYKLVGQPTLLKGYKYRKVPLNEGGYVTSGERIETVITIEAKNNYEYLVLEDLKPAGFEAVQIKSGQSLYARELKASAVQRQFQPSQGEGRISNGSPNLKQSPKRAKLADSYREPQPENMDYTGRTRWVYQELRDRKVVMFIDKLPQGVWELRYELRAEVPGDFHALPVLGHAMYIPEIRANGAEIRLTVEDRDD